MGQRQLKENKNEQWAILYNKICLMQSSSFAKCVSQRDKAAYKCVGERNYKECCWGVSCLGRNGKREDLGIQDET